MWHLVQHNPNDFTHLGCYDNYDKAKLVLMNKQRFLSHCKFELVHSSDLAKFDS